MRSYQVAKNGVLLLALSVGVLLTGCRWFVSHYDATAYQNFTNLKAYHVKFLDDFRAEDDKTTFDEAKIRSACDTGELKFREASAYASGKDDQSRVRAVEILHRVFRSDCGVAIKQKRFGAAYVDRQKDEIEKNYDLAIAGESDRVR